jgi:hypothetical protein
MVKEVSGWGSILLSLICPVTLAYSGILFLPCRGSCTCTPDALGTPSGNGPKANVWASQASYLLTIPLPFHVLSLFSLLPVVWLSLFLNTIPYYMIGPRTSLPNERVILLVHKPLHCCLMRPYNSNRDGHYTLACSTILPCLTPFLLRTCLT